MGKNRLKGNKRPQQLSEDSPPALNKDFPPNSEKCSGKWRLLLFSWALVYGCAFLLYGHALNSPLYLDDERVLYGIKVTQDPALAWIRIWTDRGVSLLSFALNFSWFGSGVVGYRIVNVLIHATSAGLVILIARRIFQRDPLLPTLVGLLFLVHPLQTQAVTYITQRMTSLAGLWFFLACYLYIRWKERAVQGGSCSHPATLAFYAGSLFTGALAVLSKENTAVLPAALLLLDWYFLSGDSGKKRSFIRQIVAVLPFAVAPLSLYFFQFSDWNAPAQTASRVAAFQGERVTPMQYLATELPVLWYYIKLVFIPYPQQLFYETPVVQSLITLKTLVSLAGHALLLGMVFLLRRSFPLISFGVIWFYLGLLVESSVIPLDPVFEHRLYLSMFGVAVLVVAVIGKLMRPKFVIVTIVLICLVLGGMTWRRNAQWNDDIAFYADNYKRAPGHTGLALTYGKRLNEIGRIDEAQKVLEGLVKSKPDYHSGYVNLAFNYIAQKKYTETVNLINRAAERKVFSAKLFYQLGNAHKGMQNFDYAVNSYLEALDINPDFIPALVELGKTYLSLNRQTDAERAFKRALELRPENGSAYLGLGMIAVRRRDLDAATDNARQAVRYLPDNSEAWFLLGATAKQRGDGDEFRLAMASLERLDKRAAQRLQRLQRSQ